MTTLTLADIKQMTKDIITPAEAAQVIGCDPQWIRQIAQDDPERLGFPAIIIRSRTRIPRLAFIKYMEGELAYKKDQGIKDENLSACNYCGWEVDRNWMYCPKCGKPTGTANGKKG